MQSNTVKGRMRSRSLLALYMNRENIIEVLQQIALKSVQIDIYEEKQISNIPAYLLKQWEEYYRPDKLGFDEEFTENELKQMNCFTDFFLVRVKSFPTEFSELLKDPYWSSVCEYAGEILKDFEKKGEQSVRQ